MAQYKVYCKGGTAVIDTEEGWIVSGYETLRKAVKDCFNYWLINEASNEVYDMYNGSFEELGGGSYYDWKGAVEAGIEAIYEYCRDNECDVKSGDFLGKIDITAVFQD